MLIVALSLTLPASTEISYAAGSLPEKSVAVTEPEVDPVDEKVEKILSKMTLKEKVAQMMIVAMPSSKASKIQKKYQFGGYILFAPDFKRTDKKGLKKLLRSCQKASKVKMLMGTDEEGGIVVRASLYSKYRKGRFRSQRSVYKDGGYKEVKRDTRTKDKFLKSLGLNMNYGPVADIPYSKYDFIYDRAYSKGTLTTTKCVKTCVKQMDKDDMISCLKHFPGYGDNGDTHGSIIRDKRSKLTFVTRDLKPFKAGIKSGADMIMMSHTIVKAFDNKRPASLSPAVHKYLRKNMDFEGVIITDGLGMDGVTDFVNGNEGKAAVRAVKAGNDMLCVTSDYEECYNAVLKAVRDGTISKAKINNSVRRILRMKIKRGIIK